MTAARFSYSTWTGPRTSGDELDGMEEICSNLRERAEDCASGRCS